VREALAFLPDVSVSTTRASGDGTTFAREAVAAGVPLVVVIGGDGTVNEVVNGLAGGLRNCELGIIPAGTGNDSARALGIPLNADDAAERLRRPGSRVVDLIEVSDGESNTLALNTVTGGMGGVVNESMPEDVKERWGPLSYARAAVSVLPELPVYDCRITIDDEPALRMAVVSVVVANGEFAARGVCVAPGARMDDGQLSLHVIRESGVTELATLIPAILRR
jgi:diacylglycerol kinase (ATP)